MIHLYHGDGKGKTTCAMGLALRALGRGKSIVIAQFLKGSQSGEITMFESLDGVHVFRLKEELPFTFAMSDAQKLDAKKQHDRIFQKAIQFANIGYCDVLVLDELCAAFNTNLIEKSLVEQFIENAPENVEIIITGRNPPSSFLEKADYITEMKAIRHPYEKGIPSREGIEY